ncbi:hypothetical protein PUMCH_002546 [Australozyma saopauloensis]|uniref:DNA polymerase alpha subunit B n=1 Tax=Australozyma saopauloensis TaxID=291208 RepID=A0AAX4H9N5_9ASCO|nr:hypothetical protein PUMCH_002546 [[Candida] saopauloensis]
MPTEIDTATKDWFRTKFGLLDEITLGKLLLIKDLFNLTNNDVYVQWESFVVTQGDGDMDLSAPNLDRFQHHLQSSLTYAHNKRTPALKKVRDLAGNKRKAQGFDFSSSPQTVDPSPRLKRRNDVPSSEPWSSPSKAEVPLSPRAMALAESDTVVESLNPSVEVGELALSVQIAANFDPEKFRFRTMAMKLLESADVLDEQIDAVSLQLLEIYKNSDILLGNPCMSSQLDIICCGRIVPDSPLYDSMPALSLNDKSLFLETSRFGGIGQRLPLDLSNLKEFSFFPGQIVGLKGRNPTGRAFVVHEVLSLPSLGAPVSSLAELTESADSDLGSKVFVAAGPFSNLITCDYTKLESLVTKLNDVIKPQVAILFGPFVDLANKSVQVGDIEVSGLTANQQPKNLDDVFRAMVTPILKQIDSLIQVILMPSLRDAVCKHASYPQSPLDRKKLGLPKNFKCFPNPSAFSINEVMFGTSNLDVFRDLKDIYKSSAEDSSISSNRFERIANHIFDQRRYYPIFPGSIKTSNDQSNSALYDGMMSEELSEIEVGGSCLEVPYMGLSELGDSLPDVMIIPSELKYFAKVIKGVIVVNPGQFIRPHRDADRTEGSYVVLNIQGPDANAPDNVEKVENSDLYYHNVYKRTRVDIYRS